jgi:NADPH2:quinone reductase
MAASCGSSPDLERRSDLRQTPAQQLPFLKVVKMTLVIAQYGQGGPEVMRAEDRDVAAPGATQVEIEQKAIGFNYFDVLQRRGFISADEPGRVMGIEGAGVVTAIGGDVTDFAVGDRVGYLRSQGAYAGKRLIEADLLFPLPEGISFETAAALTVKGFTAWLCAVRLFEVQPGQTVLVTTAAGGVGSLTARLAAHRGARVIGAVGSEAKRALARDNGAVDFAIGLDDAIEQVARLTDGSGVDVVFDGIGAGTADRLLDSGTVRSGGTIISFGASGGWPKADPDAVARRRATVVAPQVPNYIKTPAELRAGMAEVFALYRSGAFGEISPAQYPLREAVTLHAEVERRAVSGISVLVP